MPTLRFTPPCWFPRDESPTVQDGDASSFRACWCSHWAPSLVVWRTPLLLIGARILQAIGGAQLTPTSLALVLSAFPRPKWPVAISLWAAAGALAAAIGPSAYRAGLVDFLSVLEAQGELYSNEAQLVQSQSVTTDLIALYRALGGGWSVGGIVNKPTP